MVEQSWPRNGPRKPAVLWSVSNPTMMPRSFIAARKQRAVGAPLKKKAARTLAQLLHQAVERGVFQRAIGGGALVIRAKLSESRVQFKIPEMADGDDDVWGRLAGGFRGQTLDAGKFDVRAQFVEVHRGGFDGAGEIFADAPEIFQGERVDFLRRFFTGRNTWSDFATPRAGAARRARTPARRTARPSAGDEVSGSA